MLLSCLSVFALFLFKIGTWIFLISLPLGIAYYFYLKRRSTYFQRLGIPQPPITSTFLGNFIEFEKDHQQWETLIKWQKIYGQTFGILLGAHRVIVTSDFDILNEVFIKQFHTFQARMIHPSIALDQENGSSQINVFTGQGNRWKRLRSLFSASLTISKIKSVDPIMRKAHDELIEVLRRNENGIINVKPLMLDMTFAVISRSAMGINEEFVITERENESAEEKGKRHQDFLDFLREAQENNLDISNKADFDTKIPKKLTRDELIGSSHTFLLAGGDTTATLITYCLYELAIHPELEQRVLKETEEHHIKTVDDIDYDNIKNLEFLEQFVKEAARTCILPNIPVITQDEKVWGKDATEFNPDRFLQENSENRHPMAWLPFGAGLRICPGKNLAIYEIKATIVRLLLEYKFEVCDEIKTKEIMKATLGFDKLKMKVVPRKKTYCK
uniref:Cytochrome P450 n=1 Tax=Panagrolaimus sp. PS1159 TaxID=55785 RepID=A0AC35FA97_9BILA